MQCSKLLGLNLESNTFLWRVFKKALQGCNNDINSKAIAFLFNNLCLVVYLGLFEM